MPECHCQQFSVRIHIMSLCMCIWCSATLGQNENIIFWCSECCLSTVKTCRWRSTTNSVQQIQSAFSCSFITVAVLLCETLQVSQTFFPPFCSCDLLSLNCACFCAINASTACPKTHQAHRKLAVSA